MGASQLGDSVNGRELTIGRVDKTSHLWPQKPNRVFPRLHLRGIQLRGGVLPTKARRSRRRSDKTEDIICRGACAMWETLNHVLQVCDITHDTRCAHHNCVMRLGEKILKKKNPSIWMEPVIPTTCTFIKPDLVMESTDKVLVMDVSVVAVCGMMETLEYESREIWVLK